MTATEVGRQTVELQPGDNEVRVRGRRPAPTPVRSLRYQAVVQRRRGDTIAENDAGFAAVPVEGPARVLVDRGRAGRVRRRSSTALDAGGVGTDVVGVGDIPDVQELITYAGIVMVDVDARTLTGAQIDTLTTAVRDLGRGLRDDRRRAELRRRRLPRVAAVGPAAGRQRDRRPAAPARPSPRCCRSTPASRWARATAASDQTDHGRSSEGGVNKTDISRAAAERTIAALAGDRRGRRAGLELAAPSG